MRSATNYKLSKEDFEFLASQAGWDCTVEFTEDNSTHPLNIALDSSDELLEVMARYILLADFDAFAAFVESRRPEIIETAFCDEDVEITLFLGFSYGISCKSGVCADALGGFYYRGIIVDKDCKRAAELFEMALEWGCYDSIVCLADMYLNGDLGEPNYTKALAYYSLAGALAPSSESAYKLGDMYYRGQLLGSDVKKAFRLWERSLELASDPIEVAHAAIRIAPLLLDEESASFGVEVDPLRALSLYQQSEVGLRLAMEEGIDLTDRLREALEGQAKAREFLSQSS